MKKFIFSLLLVLFMPCLFLFGACGDTPNNPVNPNNPNSSINQPGNTGGEQTPEEDTYKVTVNKPSNGTITVSKTKAKEGETVVVTVQPNDGYRLVKGSLKVDEAEVENNSFQMPKKDVSLTASFEKTLTNKMIGLSFKNESGEYLKVSDKYKIFILKPTADDCTVSEYTYNYVTDTEISINYNSAQENVTFTKSGSYYNATLKGTEYKINAAYSLSGEFTVISNPTVAQVLDITDGESTLTQTNFEGQISTQKVKCYNVGNYFYMEESADSKTTKTFGEILKYDWETVVAVRTEALYRGKLNVKTDEGVNTQSFYLTQKTGDYTFENGTYRRSTNLPAEPGMPKNAVFDDLVLISNGKLQTRMFSEGYTNLHTTEDVDFITSGNNLFVTINGTKIVATIVTTNMVTDFVILNGDSLDVYASVMENQCPAGKYEMTANGITDKLVWEFKDNKVTEYVYNKDDETLISATELGAFEYHGATLIIYGEDKTYVGQCIVTSSIPSFVANDTDGGRTVYRMTKIEE